MVGIHGWIIKIQICKMSSTKDVPADLKLLTCLYIISKLSSLMLQIFISRWLIYPELYLQTPSGLAIPGDSASITQNTNGKIVRACYTNKVADNPCNAMLAALDLILRKAMLSERQ